MVWLMGSPVCSAVTSSVPIMAMRHPDQVFVVRVSPARLEISGVKSAVDWMMKAARVAVVYSRPIACRAVPMKFQKPISTPATHSLSDVAVMRSKAHKRVPESPWASRCSISSLISRAISSRLADMLHFRSIGTRLCLSGLGFSAHSKELRPKTRDPNTPRTAVSMEGDGAPSISYRNLSTGVYVPQRNATPIRATIPTGIGPPFPCPWGFQETPFPGWSCVVVEGPSLDAAASFLLAGRGFLNGLPSGVTETGTALGVATTPAALATALSMTELVVDAEATTHELGAGFRILEKQGHPFCPLRGERKLVPLQVGLERS
mmetsp:Transcript_28968/g.81581  ORF Transcript_28968/g.81581 Transcript_28968/m.81581 type:complete len:319 (+) Transcript_28968:653-1609(+)